MTTLPDEALIALFHSPGGEGTPEHRLEYALTEEYEAKERQRQYPLLAEVLRRKPLDPAALIKVEIFKTRTSGHGSVASQRGAFLRHPEAAAAIASLARDDGKPPSDVVIDAFVERACALGYQKPDGTPHRRNACLLCSVLLTALYPGDFVDYGPESWKGLAKRVGWSEPIPTGSVAAELRWAGRLARSLAATAAFRAAAKGGEPLWAIAGLTWAINKQGSPAGTTIERSEGSKMPARTNEDLASVVDILTAMMPQVILYGPPGTGKTRLARQVALRILLGSDTGNLDDSAAVTERLSQLQQGNNARFDLVVFHPAYEYDQFIGGIRVRAGANGPVYEDASAVLVRLAGRASSGTEPCVLIIDEINRGNVPRLLGELLYALEYRGSTVRLSFSDDPHGDGRQFTLPANLFIIGTMNTADRSVDSLDVALRRRFAFFPVNANPAVVTAYWNDVDPALGEIATRAMTALNQALAPVAEFGGLAVGPSYFIATPNQPAAVQHRAVALKLKHQLLPLLSEYARLAGVDQAGGIAGTTEALSELAAALYVGLEHR